MPNINVYNTHIELYPYKKMDYPVIEQMYTATDKFSGEDFACGYLIDNGILFIPRGTSISRLESITGEKANYVAETDPVDSMSRQHYCHVEPRDDLQKESIKFLESQPGQMSLNLKTGFGKGHPLTTKIPSPDDPRGYKLMGEIKPGDRVFGSNGAPTSVTEIFPLGTQDIYRITFNDGRISECTKDHLWNVFHPWSPTKIQTLRTEDMMANYKVYRKHMQDNCPNRQPWEYRYCIPLCGAVQYPRRDVEIHPYVIGALIGNGCLREQALSISSGDYYVPNHIADLCGFTFERSSQNNYTYIFRDPDHQSKKARISTREFLSPYNEMIDKYSYEKYIPEIYMHNDINTRMELLRGLLDTDGTITYLDGRFNISYSSCSKKLLEQIQELIRGLGFIANITTPDNRVDKYRNGYHSSVSVRVPNRKKASFFTHPIKYEKALCARNIPDTKQKYSYLKIIKIEKVRQDEAQCIKVDSPDHLYLTEDFIVTHNTFCVAYASTELREKTLIVTPNESIKKQWMDTYSKMFDYKSSQLMNIAGSEIIEGIMSDRYDEADVYFVNHQTLHSYLFQNNGFIFHQFMKKLKIGIKVYDESHMNFANILMIDFFSNTNRTWYLTATFDRSDKTESQCFKRAFQSVIPFGAEESDKLTRKHVIYHTVNINSRIGPREKGKLMSYPGFSSNKYGKYAFEEDKSETAYRTILTILDKTKDMEGKTLIFVPLIENVDTIVAKLKRDVPDKSCAAYHSKISKEEKESAEKKDIIVSTIKSCGTGRDIKGLRSLICCEPVASKVVIEQVIGRLRPYADDKDTYYWDVVDRSIPPLTWWYKARSKKISTLVKEMINLNL